MHRRTVVMALPLLTLAGCGGGGGGERGEDDATPDTRPAPVTVDLYSDSIGAGFAVHVAPRDRMVQMRPDWRITDHAVNGLKLAELAPVFASIQRTAQFIPLALGINDALQGEPDFDFNLRFLIESVRAEGRTPVMTGLAGLPHPPPLMGFYNAVTYQLAKEYGLQHAGWDEDYRPGDVSADGIHRTQEASDRLAALLVAAIERAALQHTTARSEPLHTAQVAPVGR